jgi:hypothetical protein
MPQEKAPIESSEVREPGPDWIPLSHAPFFFTLEGWRNAGQVLRWIELNYAPYKPSTHSDHIVLDCHGFKFAVDIMYAQFRFCLPDVRDQLLCHPSKFETDWAESKRFELDALTAWKRCQDDDLFRLWDTARSIWVILLSDFNLGVQLGSGMIKARYRSPLSPFSSVPADAWKYVKVTDWQNGIAEMMDGERLYSIHVEPQFASDGRHPEVHRDWWEFCFQDVDRDEISQLVASEGAGLSGEVIQSADAEAGCKPKAQRRRY